MKKNYSRRAFIKSGLASSAVLYGSTLLGSGLLQPLLGGEARAADREMEHTQSRLLMGTVVSITVAHSDPLFAHQSMEKAFAEIERLSAIFNRHDPASHLGRLNGQGRLERAPAELAALLGESLELWRLLPSFNVTVAPLVDLLHSRANPAGRLALTGDELDNVRGLMQPGKILLGGPTALLSGAGTEGAGCQIHFEQPGMAVTLDGIAKGAITDMASAVLLACGAGNHLINSGGDIFASGRKSGGAPWRVGITPEGGNIAETLTLRNQGLATSGPSESWYDRAHTWHHLIDPRNGKSGHYFSSVTVSAPTAKEADALATALSSLPEAGALAAIRARPDCAAFFITSDGRRMSSPGWNRS